MADGRAEVGGDTAVGAARPDCEQRDLEVEIDAALHDYPRQLHAASRERVVPGRAYPVRRLDIALSLARRRHHRLDEAWVADRRSRPRQLFGAGAERIRRGGQAKLLGSEATDAFPVHGQLHSPGRRDDDCQTVGLYARQFVGGDGLDLWHDDVRTFGLDNAAQRRRVGHRHYVGAVSNLLGRRTLVAIDGDGLDAEPLQLDHHLLAELAGAQQHDLDGGGRAGRAETDHGAALTRREPMSRRPRLV